MDGTFGGGDLISASLAIMLGGTDAELHEKSVFFSLNMIMASETGIFEYDPQDEPPSGRPPGPWDGYNFFTIDLSTVKDNIEDMLARIAELEDELEDCHGCWEDVVAKLQEYDPEYEPDEGECPTEEIGKVVDEKEHEIEALEEQIEECDQCKADVIAKLQEYDPDFDPVTCSDIPPEIDKVVEEKEGYEFDEEVPIDDILGVTANDVVNTIPPTYSVRVYLRAYASDRTTLVQEGKRVTATQATGMLYAGIYLDIIDATTGEKETMYNQYFALNPNQDSYYLEVKECILSNQYLTVNCDWGSSRTASYRFDNQNLQYLSTGPYKVTNS